VSSDRGNLENWESAGKLRDPGKKLGNRGEFRKKKENPGSPIQLYYFEKEILLSTFLPFFSRKKIKRFKKNIFNNLQSISPKLYFL